MAITLVINPGSSSKKYAWYKDDGTQILKVALERTGNCLECYFERGGVRDKCEIFDKDNYSRAFDIVIDGSIKRGLIQSKEDINTVVVRVVAPGTVFQQHAVVDQRFVSELRRMEASAPLHIPHTLSEIEKVTSFLPHSKVVAASDSAFHSTLPRVARTYSVPANDTKDLDLYRFGYHGLSVGSVVRRLHSIIGVDPKRLIVAHIGSGISVTAVKDGKSIENSMGFAPGTGAVMASRAGDVDTGSLLELMRAKNFSIFDAHTYLQTRGGLSGLLGNPDFRMALEKRASGDVEAIGAIDKLMYNLHKIIGSYITILGGLDCLVLTATASERSPVVRQLVVDGLKAHNIILHLEKNETLVGRDGVISAKDSQAKVVVMKTDEMGEMFYATKGL